MAQGHITSQTRTPGPIFPAPAAAATTTTTCTPGDLPPLPQTRQERSWPGLWRLPGASLIGGEGGRVGGSEGKGVCLEPRSYPACSGLHPPLTSSPHLPLIHSAAATVTFFQPRGLCTSLGPSAPDPHVLESILLSLHVTSSAACSPRRSPGRLGRVPIGHVAQKNRVSSRRSRGWRLRPGSCVVRVLVRPFPRFQTVTFSHPLLQERRLESSQVSLRTSPTHEGSTFQA